MSDHLPDTETVRAALGDELLRIHKETYGATAASAYVLVAEQAIETTFRSAVERATGRRVVSFASATKLAPNYVVEVFRLGPAKDWALDEPA